MFQKINFMINILLCLTLMLSLGYSQSSRMLNFQGKLMENSVAVNDNVNFTFTIYSDSAGTEVLWTEDQLNKKVINGIYQVKLGSVVEIPDTLFDGNERFLGIRINGGNELVPRFQFSSVGYSQFSFTADSARHIPDAAGDLSGSYPDITVNSIRGRLISPSAPQNDQVLKWNGIIWFPSDDSTGGSPSGSAGGDLYGTYPNPVIKNSAVNSAKIENSTITGSDISNSASLSVGSISTNYDVNSGDDVYADKTELLQNTDNSGMIRMYGDNNNYNIVLASTNTALPSLEGNLGNLTVCDEGGNAEAGMYVHADGRGIVWGDVTASKMTNPLNPDTEVWYACIEGPEAAAYLRGTASIDNGKSIIKVPEHFNSVAISEGMTVQLTPLSAESKGLAVVEKNVNQIKVVELNNGTGNYEFDFLVMAVRKGHENYQVVRDKNAEISAEAVNEKPNIEDIIERRERRHNNQN